MHRPEVVVAAIIFNAKGEVLLCKSAKWQHAYVVPGGHVEWGETLEEALIREVKEETNLEVYDVALVALKETPQRIDVIKQTQSDETKQKIGQSSTKHYIVFDFTCKTKDNSVKLNDEASAFVWCTLSEVFSYNLAPYTRAFFKAYIETDSKHKKMIIYNA